jgi:hypothetical protein
MLCRENFPIIAGASPAEGSLLPDPLGIDEEDKSGFSSKKAVGTNLIRRG